MIAYAITDPAYLDFDHLSTHLKHYAARASMIVYRDRDNPHYNTNARRFLDAARAYSFDKVLLHSDPVLARELHADGVHLREDQLGRITEAKADDLFVIVSTHSLDVAQRAEQLGADMITYGPVFSTPGKGASVGLTALEKLASSVTIPVIALGGILREEQISECAAHGAAGFASIRYFAP